MPRRVEEVRFRIDRVRLGGVDPCSFASRSSAFEYSGFGEGGKEESVEAGVSSNARRGMGLAICGVSDMM